MEVRWEIIGQVGDKVQFLQGFVIQLLPFVLVRRDLLDDFAITGSCPHHV